MKDKLARNWKSPVTIQFNYCIHSSSGRLLNVSHRRRRRRPVTVRLPPRRAVKVVCLVLFT